MNILKLTVQGFKSFSTAESIEFDKLDAGLFFVTGRNEVEPELGANGVGKSALFEALSFAFFGKTSTNLKAGDIKNKFSSEPCVVEVRFFTHTGMHYLQRTWNPNTLLLDGKVVTQQELESLIKLNFDSFSYSILISQFGNKFIDFKQAEKMEIFTSILDDKLGAWDIFTEKSKLKVDAISTKCLLLETEIANLKGRIESLDVSFEDKIDEWKKDKEVKLQDLQTSITDTKTEILLTKKSAVDIDYKRTISQSGLKDAETTLDSLVDLLDSYTQELANFQKKKIEQTVLLNTLTSKETQLLTAKNDCPVCSQTITEDFKTVLLDNVKLEIATKNRIIRNLIEDEELFLQNKQWGEKLKFEETTNIKTFEKTIQEYNLQLARVDTLITSLTSKLSLLQTTYETINDSSNPYETILEENQQQLEELNKLLQTKECELDSSHEDLEIYKYWTKAFKEIKLMLIEEALKDFEISINNYVAKLGMPDWQVKLSIDSENKSGTIKKGFTIKVVSPDISENLPFEAWSGGEGQRIRLATTLGLVDFIKSRRGSFSDILILDEPTQYLSEEGIRSLLDNLLEIATTDSRKIFLIDHRELTSYGLFKNVLTVTKDEKGSKLSWQN